ncbi:MAG: DUF5681 domain-containing protein [Thermomicrobiales bacterium]
MSDEPPTPHDYPVGRCKTPEHSRYKPGQSGNPKGRPKGSRNLKTEFNEEMNERVEITENGKTRRPTKRRIVVKSAIIKAGKGNVTAQRNVLELDLKLNGIPEDKIAIPLSPAEQALVDRMNALLASDHMDPPEGGVQDNKDG